MTLVTDDNHSHHSNLFSYGTLAYGTKSRPDFLMQLLKRDIKMADAILRGYVIKEPTEDFPYRTLVEKGGSETRGKVVLNLAPYEIKMIDVWETYNIKEDDIILHKDELRKAVAQDGLESYISSKGLKKIGRYSKKLENVVTSEGELEAWVYISA